MSVIKLETPAETRERCKAHGAEWFGDKTEFSPPGQSFKRAAVRAIFASHDCGKYLPSEPKSEALLKRAGREGRTPKGYICRAFVSPLPDTPMAIHVTRVEGTGESGDEYSCLARVRIAHRIDPVTGATEPFAVAKPPEGQIEFADLTARDRAIWIANHCNVLMHEAQNKDLGLWIRAALYGVGAVQSIGGGNNFYAPRAICDKLFALMSDLKSAGMLEHYVRDPKTSLGARHERAVMAASAEHSLADDIEKMRGELKDAVGRGNGKRKRDHYHSHQIGKLGDIDNRLALYRDIVEAKVLAPLREATELYRQHFTTLLDGGAPDWATDSDEDETPAAPSEAPGSNDGAIAASGERDEDFAWFS